MFYQEIDFENPVEKICLKLQHPQASDCAAEFTKREKSKCLAFASKGALKFDCLGKTAEICNFVSGYGDTTSLASCNRLEAELWEAEADAAFEDLIREYNQQESLVLRGNISRLSQSQGAWKAYVAAECRYQRWIKGEGSMGRILATRCRYKENGKRALKLRQTLYWLRN